jgi:hypothetical protein
MKTIRDILAFVNDGIEAEVTLCIAKRSSDFDVTARVVCIKLLAWLSRRGSWRRRYARRLEDYPSCRALRLEDYPWCRALKASIENCEALSNLFVLNGDNVDFRPEIDSASIQQIESEVGSGYRPPLFVD